MTISRRVTMRNVAFALLAAATATQGFDVTSSASLSSRHQPPCSTGANRLAPLFLSDSTAAEDPKTKLALDLQRLFDIDQMAYTVMVREEQKGVDGKLTPDELIAAIQKDGMFGEDFEEYCQTYASDGDVRILDIGKFSDDMESSAPLPEEDNLTIPGKGNYLVHLSFAEGILATMRVVVD